jgi:formate dehydrogenase maturation protein FdhE
VLAAIRGTGAGTPWTRLYTASMNGVMAASRPVERREVCPCGSPRVVSLVLPSVDQGFRVVKYKDRAD